MNQNEQLNRGQSDAVMHAEGPCIVIAPPGSGKTRVLTQRIHALIKDYGVCPKHILVVTFTRAAAGQMRERCLACCNESDIGVTFGTFHAIFFRMVKESLQMGAALDAYRKDQPLLILSEKEKKQILTAIINQSEERRAQFPDTEQLCAYISRRKNCMEIANAAKEAVCHADGDELAEAVWREYCETCRELGRLDFEDITDCCRKILQDERNKRILAYWRDKYRYLLVDEFQDISPMQFAVLRLIAAPRDCLFVVGDDDQSIYGFRGADTRLMLDMPVYYPGLRICRLTVNYRSGHKIVAAAGRLIARNRLRYDKEISAKKAESGEVRLVVCPEKRIQMHRIGEALLHVPQKETMAVIVRTNAQAAEVQRLIRQLGIPAEELPAANARNLYEHPVARDVLAYLKLAAGEVSAQEALEAMLRVINKPYRGVSRQAVIQSGGSMEALCRSYERHTAIGRTLSAFQSQLSVLAQLPLFSVVAYICKGIGYERELSEKAVRGGMSEVRYVLAALRREAEGMCSLKDWLSAAADGRVSFSANERPAVANAWDKGTSCHIKVLTMHACKGLEFDHVLLPYLNEGVIPHKKAFLPEELEEERRLLYVAMTRARKTLLMTCIHKQGDQKYQMSRFLRELI